MAPVAAAVRLPEPVGSATGAAAPGPVGGRRAAADRLGARGDRVSQARPAFGGRGTAVRAVPRPGVQLPARRFGAARQRAGERSGALDADHSAVLGPGRGPAGPGEDPAGGAFPAVLAVPDRGAG